MFNIGFGISRECRKGCQKPSKLLALFGCAAILCAAPESRAVSITSVFTDLPDQVSGQDLWKVSYSVGGGSFVQGEGFSVIQDHNLFSNFSLLHSPDPNQWDTLLVPYDSGLNADGYLDALALVNNPIQSDTFDLSFIWLGARSPGIQDVELYQLDPNNPSSFTSLGMVQTVLGDSIVGISGVPESGYGLTTIFAGILLTMGYMSKRTLFSC